MQLYYVHKRDGGYKICPLFNNMFAVVALPSVLLCKVFYTEFAELL